MRTIQYHFLSVKKRRKKSLKYLDVINKTSTFAPAFERERH